MAQPLHNFESRAERKKPAESEKFLTQIALFPQKLLKKQGLNLYIAVAPEIDRGAVKL